jgi:hypothetical protein
LVTTRPGRIALREAELYPVIRDFHKLRYIDSKLNETKEMLDSNEENEKKDNVNNAYDNDNDYDNEMVSPDDFDAIEELCYRLVDFLVRDESDDTDDALKSITNSLENDSGK